MALNCASKPQWAHLEYCWKLENFWELRALASIEALEEDSGDVVWSRRFGDRKRGLWRLKVYPYGDTSPAGKGHVSVFLALDTKAMMGQKVYAIFGCYVLDAHGNKIQGSGRSFTRQKFAEGSASWGWSQFIKADDTALMGMLVDDTLTLKCDIDVFIGVKASSGRDISTPLSFREEMTNYLEQNGSKDVIIKTNENEIAMNKTLLAARSMTFRQLLSPTSIAIGSATVDTTTSASDDTTLTEIGRDSTDSRQLDRTKVSSTSLVIDPSPTKFVIMVTTNNLVTLELTHPDITFYAVKQMTDYILTDTCDIFTDVSPPLTKILEVFVVSFVYHVQSLKRACIELLLCRITAKSDVKLILTVAEQFNCDILVSECHTFLQYFTPELQGPELMKLLLPNTKSGSTRTNTSPSSKVPTPVG